MCFFHVDAHIDMFNVYVYCVAINSIAHEDSGLLAFTLCGVNSSNVQMDHSALVSGLLDHEDYSTEVL